MPFDCTSSCSLLFSYFFEASVKMSVSFFIQDTQRGELRIHSKKLGTDTFSILLFVHLVPFHLAHPKGSFTARTCENPLCSVHCDYDNDSTLLTFVSIEVIVQDVADGSEVCYPDISGILGFFRRTTLAHFRNQSVVC